MSIIIILGTIIVLFVLIRYVVLEFLNRKNLERLQEEIKETSFIITPARQVFALFSEPVVIALRKGYISIYHSVPFIKPQDLRFKEIKEMGMDTFLPSGTPIDYGRVIKITKKNGKQVVFVIKKDIDPWRAWIQSFGFRA